MPVRFLNTLNGFPHRHLAGLLFSRLWFYCDGCGGGGDCCCCCCSCFRCGCNFGIFKDAHTDTTAEQRTKINYVILMFYSPFLSCLIFRCRIAFFRRCRRSIPTVTPQNNGMGDNFVIKQNQTVSEWLL